ncbi:hypothetical protein LV779_08805 [Streptomyces thinghirensis]|nr:hypothetical protein [Streptomyces thinghirensis]
MAARLGPRPQRLRRPPRRDGTLRRRTRRRALAVAALRRAPMLASRRALELARVDGPRTFDQATAEVVCDADGTPTGLLPEDAACELVERIAPQPTRERRDRLPRPCAPWPPPARDGRSCHGRERRQPRLLR